MKSRSFLILILVSSLFFSGCQILKPRQTIQAERVEQTSNLIDKKVNQIEDRGRSFLWGAK